VTARGTPLSSAASATRREAAAAGQRNDIDEAVIRDTFAGWRIDDLEQARVPSDTRLLDVLVVRLCCD
jgi:hypothetical protein